MKNTTQTSTIDLIKQFEGFRSSPYYDSAMVPTIGYGSTYCLCGTKVNMSMKPITEEVGAFMLGQNIKIYASAVDKIKVPLTQNQYDALTSLCYNIGVTNFNNSTLVRKLNAKDYKGAADQFLVWKYAGGNIVQGLVNRRAKERTLFLK